LKRVWLDFIIPYLWGNAVLLSSFGLGKYFVNMANRKHLTSNTEGKCLENYRNRLEALRKIFAVNSPHTGTMAPHDNGGS